MIGRKPEGRLWFISGEVGAGKTILCAALVKEFTKLGWQISGLRSPAIMEAGFKTGIAVENLASKEVRKLAVRAMNPNALKDEPFHWTFDPLVLDWGNQVLKHVVPTDLLVVDEIGPLEMKRGEGWVNAFDALDSRQYRQAILVMRPKLLSIAQARWPWGQTILIESVDQVSDIKEECIQVWVSGS